MESSSKGPELQVQYTADVSGLEKGSDKAKKVIQGVSEETKKSGKAFDDFGGTIDKVSGIMGGTLATAALAVATAIYDANEQVENMEKSLRISSGTQQNYEENSKSLQTIADKYSKSIFTLTAGYNALTRETRNTVNEGAPTAAIFDTLTSVSGKLGVSIDESTGEFTSFIDKMKEGTVDSKGLSTELDHRLYDSFVKVAGSMGITTEELNKVLKASEEAVSTILPQLAEELGKSLGDIPQQDATDLGNNIEFARSKLTLLLDGLYQTAGGKGALAEAALDAGNFLDVLNKIQREHGIGAAVGASIVKAGTGLANGIMPGLNLETDPFGYRRQMEAEQQRAAIAGATKGITGWNQPTAGSPYKLPSKITKEDYNIAAKAFEIRKTEEEKANRKLIAEQKRLAGERKRAQDEINRREIYESNLRIKEGIVAAEAAVELKYRKFNGVLGTMGQASPTGSKEIFKGYEGTNKFALTNPVSGGGGSTTNFDHITQQINEMTAAWWKEKIAKDASAASTNDLAISLEDLEDDISAIIDQGKVELFSGIGEALGALTVDAGGLEDAGAKITRIMGDMVSQIGKAIIAYALTMDGLKKALKVAFKNPYVALAVGIAAVAAGAALRATANKKSEDAARGMYTGGIVEGPAGVDLVPTRLSKGEIVMNSTQQNRLWGFINGTNTGSINQSKYGSGSGSITIDVQMQSVLKGADIETSSRKATRRENFYR
ncbi:hypothetical protein [Dyadobacter sp. CY351]|uniref:hypothetical protein n=1 Tax=Dyadobacter sp. CY351 TaxID=2909337 RepID=UPI001F21C7FD|nr:hypothetical protein [Dyadobacter sp. CY351]MCF2517124.1 hypothetical protein [Dyadobacter sp. CY351]